jgi:hypothetical protein
MTKQWTAEQAAAQVNRIYQQVLERPADDTGLVAWGGPLSRGEMSVRDVVRGVGHSDEYWTRFVAGGAENAAVLMYRHFLAREPESQIAVDGHEVTIAGNWKAGVNGFVDSVEYAQRFGDDTPPHP